MKIALLSLLLLASPLPAQTIRWHYVTANGNDANPGTADAPRRTISASMPGMTKGDTIVVGPGRYDVAAGEQFPIVIPSGVAVIGTHGWWATIVDATGSGARVFRFSANVSNNEGQTFLQGFTITGGTATAAPGADAVGGAILFENGDQTIVRNNWIEGNVAYGAGGGNALGGAMHSAGSAPTIICNLIRLNTARGGDGTPGGAGRGGAISISGGRPIIVFNTIVENTAQGGNGGNGEGGAFHGGGGIIRNNIVAYNTAAGGTPGDGAMAGGAPADWTKNIRFQNVPGGSGAGDPLFDVDPRFVAPAHGNYHIRADSPAVKAAAMSGMNAWTDLDYMRRRFGQHSIGAFDFTRSALPADFGGFDAVTDLSIFRPATGRWFIRVKDYPHSPPETWTFHWGSGPDDIPVPAAYRASGTSIAYFRRGEGNWFILGLPSPITSFGMGPNDWPVPADYDGDRLADVAIFRPGEGHWFIRRSGDGSLLYVPSWGVGPNDIPVPGEYDGDGIADIAVFRPGDGHWFIRRSTTGTMLLIPNWGMGANDVPVPADYDGDGLTDAAVFRPGTAEWFVRRSSDGTLFYVPSFGPLAGDRPVPGDYDGDGRADIAIFRPGGEWFIRSSADGTMLYFNNFGSEPGDLPVPGYAR